MLCRTSCLAILLGALVLPAICQEAAPAAVPELTPLAAADEAARGLDYVRAQDFLTRAAEGASPELVGRIKQRQILYERFQSLGPLVDFARQNPGVMVGLAITRDGRNLQGRLQVLELGVTSAAAIGNRRLDKGSLALRLADDATRNIPGAEIAQLSIGWLAPDAAAGTGLWSIEKIRAVLQSGEVVEGKPTWLMPLCALSVRPPDATDDTELIAFPGMDPQAGVDGLVMELVILGGPPPAVEVPAGPATTTGPVSGHPEETR